MIKLKDIIKDSVIESLLEAKTKNEGAYDDDADKQGRDDGESWMANSSAGNYGAKYKGKIRYFDDKDSAKTYAKSGTKDSKDSKGGEGDNKKDSSGKLSGSDFDRQADKEEPKGKLPVKYQDSLDELEDVYDVRDVEAWLENHERKLTGKIGSGARQDIAKFNQVKRDMEVAEEYDDDELYEDKLELFKDMAKKAINRLRK